VKLRARLEQVLGAKLPETTATDLETLERLLARWGKAVDLVGFKTEGERDRRYFAEALAALSWLPETGRALDIGSGGGSPALPLAVARRSIAWTLVEANERKAMFLEEAVRALRLETADVVRGRYQSYEPTAVFDVITLRGVAVTEDVLGRAASQVHPSGRLLWFTSQARVDAAGAVLANRWARREEAVALIAGGGVLGVYELIA